MADRADRLVAEFSECLSVFNAARLFTGPSVYFHERTVQLVSQHKTPSEAIADRDVVEAIYATPTSWGMHRMGPKGAKLPPFATFEEGLARAAPHLDDLAAVRLDTLDNADAVDMAGRLWTSVEGLEVSATASRLVAGSKTIHHLHPELLPPIDRRYTAQFFYGSAGKSLYMGEDTALKEILPHMAKIATECSTQISRELDRSDAFLATSASKVVDNAIVGYVIKHQDRS